MATVVGGDLEVVRGMGSGSPRVAAAKGPFAVDPAARAGQVPLNEVRLRGRLVGAVERALPSGDLLVTARLVVPRPQSGVDTIDCAVWRAGLRRSALRVPEGAAVQVEGSLRRRFWRTAGGAGNRYEVEVSALRRLPAGGRAT